MNRAGRISFFLLGLLFLAFAPRIALGFYDKAQAERAAQAEAFSLAAQNYRLAAQRLFWEPSLWERAGKSAWKAGKTFLAQSSLEEAKTRGVLSDEGREILGKTYLVEGDWQRALTMWHPLLEENKGDAALYEDLARIYETMYPDETETMLKIYRQWLQRDSENAYAQYRLGMYLVMDAPNEALTHWMNAARVDENYDSVVQTLRTGVNLALIQEDDASRYLYLGRALALAEEWRFAKEAFERATLANLQNGEAWAWLGEAQQHLGEDGDDAVKTALRLSPHSTVTRSLAGLYWQRKGEYALAEAQFLAAARLEPENPAWQAALGETYALDGDLPKALTAYQRAVELAPNSPTYWRLLAQFCVNYDVYLEDVGLPAAQKALALSNQDSLSWDTLGEIYFLLDMPKDAENAFSRALESNPNFALAYLHLGKVYLSQGMRDLAKENLQRAYETARSAALADEAKRLLDVYFP